MNRFVDLSHRSPEKLIQHLKATEIITRSTSRRNSERSKVVKRMNDKQCAQRKIVISQTASDEQMSRFQCDKTADLKHVKMRQTESSR
ncbi:hypothetical protein NPIL_673511 [Nephila pilipes]|uniref:Uncharacterized protein n=1 Tax=Nephila pilipes TaxID=299642 RepID=A0A8X6MIH5_NEPPI|nr:hypothetical protein NPIL_673511 [Nephila pilipes]